MEIRCRQSKRAEIDDGIISIKCSSRLCGAGNGVVVIHRWNVLTGERLEDARFRDPIPRAARQQEGIRL